MRTLLMLLVLCAWTAAGCGGSGGAADGPGVTSPVAGHGRLSLHLRAPAKEAVLSASSGRALVRLLDAGRAPVVGDADVDLSESRRVTLSGIPFGTWTLEVTLTQPQSFFRTRVTIGPGDPVTVGVVPVTAVDLAVEDPQIPVGLATRVKAMGLTGGRVEDLTADVEWSVSDEAVACPDGEPGRLVSQAEGTVLVTAVYGPLRGETSVRVTPAALVSLEVEPTSLSLPAGLSAPLKAFGLFTDGRRREVTDLVSWSTSDAAVASLDGPQVVGHVPGNAVVTVASGAVSATAPVQVTAAVLTGLSVSPPPVVAVGRSASAAATGIFSDGSTLDLTRDVQWNVSPPGLATVSPSGVVAGVAPGLLTLTATHPGTGRTATGSLEVAARLLEVVQVNPGTVGMPRGTEKAFTALGQFSDGSSEDVTEAVDWVSSDPTMLLVSNLAGSRGRATAAGDAGRVTLEATDPVTGASGSASITLAPAVLVALDVTPGGWTMTVGDTVQYRARGIYSDRTEFDVTEMVEWSSGDPGSVTISNATGSRGLATAVGPGSGVPITAFHRATGLMHGAGVTVTGGGGYVPPGGGGYVPPGTGPP